MPDIRLTPYELAFAGAGFDRQFFPGLREEAEARGVDTRDADRFAFLTVAADALREMIPENAPPQMLEQFRALLFHAYNFWSAGRQSYLLDPPVARYLVEAAPTQNRWQPRLPHPGIYVQLPRHLFWARVSPEATPEPVDGFFATTRGSGAGDQFQPSAAFEGLLVLGLLPDRPGFAVVPLEREAVAESAAGLAFGAGREGGRDFANVLPGGEIRGLYSIVTNTEAAKLVFRSLWYIDQHPDCLSPRDRFHLVTLTAAPG